MRNSKQWYDHIDELVIRYQEGDNSCGILLLDAFEPYLIKFLKIIQDGLLNLNDKDSCKFISLFIADEEIRKNLTKTNQSVGIRNEAHKTASFLSQTCSCMSSDDIKQELRVTFLTLAKRWKKGGVKTNFCGYIYNSFRYELHRNLIETIKDPLSYKAYMNIRYDDTDVISEYEDYKKDIDFDDVLMLVIEDELDNSWIEGITCSDMFIALTPLQRSIVKHYYIDGLTDQKIASKLKMHVNTIFIHRRKAVNLLKTGGN